MQTLLLFLSVTNDIFLSIYVRKRLPDQSSPSIVFLPNSRVPTRHRRKGGGGKQQRGTPPPAKAGCGPKAKRKKSYSTVTVPVGNPRRYVLCLASVRPFAHHRRRMRNSSRSPGEIAVVWGTRRSVSSPCAVCPLIHELGFTPPFSHTPRQSPLIDIHSDAFPAFSTCSCADPTGIFKPTCSPIPFGSDRLFLPLSCDVAGPVVQYPILHY
ncbi:hypothetical protein CGRA01v4_12416 [Colletotrichum graminicola]|nr:hypothetical protein CGRA01v4_12416 [Colletotrichum graminicola]